jgi:cytochrome c-type biogenesis protein
VIDPLAAISAAVTHGSPLAIGSIFLAGVASSLGPCVAPRYLAVAGFASGARRPGRAALAFIAGLIGAYVLLGFGAGFLGSMRSLAGVVDGILAVALVAAGALMLWGAEPARDRACSHVLRDVPSGAPLLLGAASAFVVSPCCTPILAAIVATAAEFGRPLAGASVLACFALGHALPLFVIGSLGTLVQRFRCTGSAAQSPAVIGGALLLCLGAFYGTLA